jgi:hypothetical protein
MGHWARALRELRAGIGFRNETWRLNSWPSAAIKIEGNIGPPATQHCPNQLLGRPDVIDVLGVGRAARLGPHWAKIDQLAF